MGMEKLFALVFLPQIWSQTCLVNSVANDCASRFLIDANTTCTTCDATECCVYDTQAAWVPGFYTEIMVVDFFTQLNVPTCDSGSPFVPLKRRSGQSYHSSGSLYSYDQQGQFMGFVEWKSASPAQDVLNVTCSGFDFYYDFKFGSPLDFGNDYVRVPYVVKFYQGSGGIGCQITVNDVIVATTEKNDFARLWARNENALVDPGSATEFLELISELNNTICAEDPLFRGCSELNTALTSGSASAACGVPFIQCLSLPNSTLAMNDVNTLWVLHDYGAVASAGVDARAADMVLGNITHVALLWQHELLPVANLTSLPSVVVAIAVYNSTHGLDIAPPPTLQAFVATASTMSIDPSVGNLTSLTYFSGPLSAGEVLVNMPAAVTVTLFPRGWGMANVRDWQKPINRNLLCAYQAKREAASATDSCLPGCTNPAQGQYCLQGSWPQLETIAIAGFPMGLARCIANAPKLRQFVIDSTLAASLDLRVNPLELLQVSNNPLLTSLTFTASLRATSVRVYGNLLLDSLNTGTALEKADMSFSSTSLTTAFHAKSSPSLLSYTCIGCSLSAIPALESKMPKLKYLDLSMNRIEMQLATFVVSPQWAALRQTLCRLNLAFNAIGGSFPANYTDLIIRGCAGAEEPQLDFSNNMIESFKSPGLFVTGTKAGPWASQFQMFPPAFSSMLCDTPALVSNNTRIPWLVLRSNRLKGEFCNSSMPIDITYNNWWKTSGGPCVLVSTWITAFGKDSERSMYMPFSVSWMEEFTLNIKYYCPWDTSFEQLLSINNLGTQQTEGLGLHPVMNDAEETLTSSQPIVFSPAGEFFPQRKVVIYNEDTSIYAQLQWGRFRTNDDANALTFEVWTTKSCSFGRGTLNGLCEVCPLNTWSQWCGHCVAPSMDLLHGFRHTSCSQCPISQLMQGTTPLKQVQSITSDDASVGVDQCVCPFGSYGFPATLEAGNAVSTCRDCGTFAICQQTNETRPQPRDGWYYNYTENLFLLCDPSKACKSGGCVAGYSPTPGGAPCSGCTEGFYRVNRECRECFKAAPFLLVLLAVFLVFALFFLLRVSKTDATKIFTISISLGYIQIISIFAAFPVTWPQQTQDLLNFLSFFNFNFDLASPECAVKTTFWNKWLMKLMIPLIAVFILFAWYLIVRYCPKVQDKWVRFVTRKASLDRCLLRIMVGSNARRLVRDRELIAREAEPIDQRAIAMEWEKNHLGSRFVSAVITLGALGYTYVAKTSTQPFNCLQTIYEVYPHLRADPSISCYDDTWYAWLPLSIFFILIYLVGIPLGFLAILMRGYRKKKLKDPEFLAFYGNLVLPFRDQYWFWEIIQLSRKLVTVLFIDFKADASDTTTFGQINGVLLVLVLFFVLQQFVRPYEFTWCNRLEFAWTGMTLLILMAALVFSFNTLTPTQLNAYAVFLILAICIALAITVYTLFLEKRRVLVRVGLGNAALHKIEADHALLNEVFGEDLGDSIYRQTRGMSPELREQFFAKVSDLTPMGIPQQISELTPLSVKADNSQQGKNSSKGKSNSKGNPDVFPDVL